MLRPLYRLIAPWIVAALFVYWRMSHTGPAMVAVAVAAYLELILWFQRCARAEQVKVTQRGGRPGGGLEGLLLNHPMFVVVGLLVVGVLVDAARVSVALARFWHWALLGPAVLVHRQRWQRARAERECQLAQRIIDGASTQSHVIAGAAMRDKALGVLRRPLGLRPELPPPPPLPPAPAELVPVNVRYAQGVIVELTDGTHRFESMEPRS